MQMLDCSAAIIRPTNKFLQWLDEQEKDSPFPVKLTLEQLRSNCTVLLVPEQDTPEGVIGYVGEHYRKIFTEELSSWYDDESTWPADLSLKSFWDFFEVEVHDVVVDIEDN